MARPDSAGGTPSPLASLYANDPAMRGVVCEFVGELPDRIRSIWDAFTTDDRDGLTRLAHQLRGAGTGYGYPALTTAAGALEDRLRALPEAGSVASVADEVDELIAVCERAARGSRAAA